ncbi:MAG TPA: nuclear transport factor 2 family protein [Cytophagales bacterium]|nr:nuclear transport factor 2 family protein [Cytophagales bacterium]
MNDITTTCSNIFVGSDSHNWDKVKNSFSDEVWLDYSSFTGEPPATIKSTEIIKAWSDFLPRFKFTMHYLSNFEVDVKDGKAFCSAYGHAIHHSPEARGGDLFEVYGTYNFELQKENDKWAVTSMTYNHKYSAGNLELPALV